VVPVFFALSACSWVPHWACHYYRLETGSGFRVGSWQFSAADSVVAMTVYSCLIAASLAAVALPSLRFPVGVVSGIAHLAFAALHAVRIVRPFRFEVFGYPWSMDASLREVFIVGIFGVVSIAIGALASTPAGRTASRRPPT